MYILSVDLVYSVIFPPLAVRFGENLLHGDKRFAQHAYGIANNLLKKRPVASREVGAALCLQFLLLIETL